VTKGKGPPASTKASDDSALPPETDPALDTLREILFSHYRQQIAELEAELNQLEERIENKDAFVAMVTPILGDAIRRKIRDAREEMIEALYPVIGQTVVRAVSESIRDLRRSVDAQMRSSLNIENLGWRFQGRIRGVSSAEMVLRESLPFDVAEIFLIHRESGLLLWHISRTPDSSANSDLISGMLTAIRDFTAEAFGQGKEGQLEEIQYGQWRILIEAAQYAYLAVVIEGSEPPGFRSEMRERIIEIDLAHEGVLRNYEGDAEPLAPVEPPLRSLIMAKEAYQLSPTQKRVLAGLVGTLTLCLVATCLVGFWGWQALQTTPTPAPVVIVPTATSTSTSTPTLTATPTATATPTPTPTSTFTPAPTLTPTFTPTPTATPVAGIMVGNVWLRQGPFPESPRLGLILERGQPVEILAASGDWYWIRWAPQDQAMVTGWTPVEWVGTFGPIPDNIVTPTATAP
jgi:hypothetical protein